MSYICDFVATVTEAASRVGSLATACVQSLTGNHQWVGKILMFGDKQECAKLLI